MSRKIKTLIAALVVLALLGGGYYGSTVWKKKKAATASKTASSDSPKLGNLDSAKLARLEVPGIVLEKKGDLWQLTSLGGKVPPKGIDLDQSPIQSLAYSLASIYVDRVVDDNPSDLSVYGLSNPSVRAIVTDSGGKKAEYIRGDMTPSRSSYYVMQQGDPRVYIVSSYSADNMAFALDKIRNKSLFPAFEFPAVKEFQLDGGGSRIVISPKPASAPPYLEASFSTLIMTSPYKLTRGVDSEAMDKAITPLKGLQVQEFVDDNPSSLQPYGLDKPLKIHLVVKGTPPDSGGTAGNNTNTNLPDQTLDLLVGKAVNGNYYAKTAGAPAVFTVSGVESVVGIKPFSLIDKFALLINIDKVDHLSVTGGPKPLTADFQGKGDDGVYSLNGKKTDSSSFKKWYQAVIGLLSDSEYPGPAKNPETAGGNITIEYQLNTPAGVRTSITLVPYDRDFYALRQEGTMEFLVSRNQVNKIYETADAVTYQ
ncbi:MAG: DUF4340 domain-containing protein [Treponema sp.]|nr:DUF4340 domain-containing protein [Treponema sp.]